MRLLAGQCHTYNIPQRREAQPPSRKCQGELGFWVWFFFFGPTSSIVGLRRVGRQGWLYRAWTYLASHMAFGTTERVHEEHLNFSALNKDACWFPPRSSSRSSVKAKLVLRGMSGGFTQTSCHEKIFVFWPL